MSKSKQKLEYSIPQLRPIGENSNSNAACVSGSSAAPPIVVYRSGEGNCVGGGSAVNNDSLDLCIGGSGNTGNLLYEYTCIGGNNAGTLFHTCLGGAEFLHFSNSSDSPTCSTGSTAT